MDDVSLTSHTRPPAADGVAERAALPIYYPARKGRRTHHAILDTALAIVSRDGIKAISFGELARHMNMARSGIFAHFQSHDNLVLQLLERYRTRFLRSVFEQALSAAPGLPRLRLLLTRWTEDVAGTSEAQSPFISALIHYDSRPGPIRDKLADMADTWKNQLYRCVQQAIDAGHLRQDTDAWQLIYECHGLVLALHHEVRLFGVRGDDRRAQRAIERVISAYLPE